MTDKTEKIISIAIDGPSGSGKSTIAKELAERLGIHYLDTGAMYRAITLKVLRSGIHPENEEEVSKIAKLAMIHSEDENVFLDGENVNEEIRSEEVTKNVSLVSSYEKVREHLVTLQRKIAKNQSIIVDGRDIGTVVLPNADIKIFLTASLEERAKRRQLQEGLESLEETMRDLNRRDLADSTREHSPLKQADDAYLYDNTGESLEETVKGLLERIGDYNVL